MTLSHSLWTVGEALCGRLPVFGNANVKVYLEFYRTKECVQGSYVGGIEDWVLQNCK